MKMNPEYSPVKVHRHTNAKISSDILMVKELPAVLEFCSQPDFPVHDVAALAQGCLALFPVAVDDFFHPWPVEKVD